MASRILSFEGVSFEGVNFEPANFEPANCDRAKHYTKGFTYIGLLIFIAIIGVASAATLRLGSVLLRRAAEEELLDIGEEFRQALISYANASPVGPPGAPRSLQDLLKDPRYPRPVRHLRKLYADPITGRTEWGTLEAVDGNGIVGVYSLSDAKPIKIENFDPMFQDFAGKTSYRDWLFSSTPQLYRRPNP
ncbi:type II secretion system protein [Undibacterium arcticum]|uniref:Type II secretion system protein n=1 Tax=Undibacterium arcticum TaxID=1762892 RepID=A0ABV7F8P1_9BURK